MGIRIRGVGSYVPERVLTNADLEKMVETSDEWIVSRTGIRQRHIAAPEQACSDIAAGAARAALANCGMDATELDLIIVSTISPDMAIPSTAALVQHKIGAKCPAFYVEAACTGLLYNMNIAYGMMSAPKFISIHSAIWFAASPMSGFLMSIAENSVSSGRNSRAQ